jgi:PleD family two-component response regulator
MSILTPQRPRVLLAAGAAPVSELRNLFAREPLDQWEPLTAESFAHARFVLQHNPCDLLVVNSDLVDREGPQGLAWLAFQHETPVLFLGEDQAEPYSRAYELGIHNCLSRRLAVAHPPLLGAVMRQALQSWEMKHRSARIQDQLAQARRHVDRLVNLIWRITPRHDDQWYSQRHMLDRLAEEVARCQRYGVPLSVALGEMYPDERDAPPRLPDAAAERLLTGKRRSDVIGQYGPGGFLLLMVQTPKMGGVTCCRRLQEHLQHPAQELAGPRTTMRTYFGVACTAVEQPTPQALLHIAEKHLEEARKTPESRIVAD